MMNVIDCLEERGLIESTTSDSLSRKLAEPTKVYLGFDPTADSLHVGNLVGVIVLGWFKRCGHMPIALVGGATGLIGDPSGKNKERLLQTPEQVRHNLEGIRRDIEAVLGEIWVVNNYDWFGKIGFIEFLRDVGKHCRMGPMLGKEMVRNRLESDEGMSYTEFSYQLLQGYDFVHLFDELGVTMQLGGSDQWGNITSGTELVRKLKGKTVHGLTFPLLTDSEGKKLGKTESGAIWLSPKRLSPYEFYQYFVRLPDADVIRLMRMLTYMEMSEIRKWKARMVAEDYVANSAQKCLAKELTRLVHGETGLEIALKVTQNIVPGSLEQVSGEVLRAVAKDMPSMTLEAIVGLSLLDLLVETDLAKSKGEGRRLIKNGGLYLNNVKIKDENRCVEKDDLIEGNFLLVGVGKKRKLLVKTR